MKENIYYYAQRNHFEGSFLQWVSTHCRTGAALPALSVVEMSVQVYIVYIERSRNERSQNEMKNAQNLVPRSIVQASWLLVLLLGFCFNPQAEAQWIRGKDNRREAREHIKDLEKGILIVRLPSKHKNIQAIETVLLSDKLTAKERNQLIKELNKIRTKQNKTNNEIRYSFEEHYQFSQFRFIHDTATIQLLNGQTSGFFLDKNMLIDTTISIDPNLPLYILSFGQTDVAETQNLEGYIISDYKNRVLPKPFPYFIRSAYSPTNFLNALVGKSEAQFPNFTKMTYKLNNKLTTYLKEVIYEEKNRELKQELKEMKKELKEEEK